MSSSTTKWPTEVAKTVKIVLDEDAGANNDDVDDDNLARIEYNATDRYICLVRGDDDGDDGDKESARTILDTIDVDDMIGASIEISMLNDDATDPIRATTTTNSNDDDRDEDDDAARYQSNEPSSINAVDTQARAVLNLYVYPRQDSTSIWKRCVGRLFSPRSSSSSPSSIATPHYQRPADVSQHGPRAARHRRWTLAAAEDLHAAQRIVQALRQLATPHAFDNDDDNNDDGGRCRCLLLVNPRSGPHRDAAARAEAVVAPLLEQAGLDVTVCVTTHPRHATERCRRADVRGVRGPRFGAVVTMGGDGIVHEALNGLVLSNSNSNKSKKSNNNNNNNTKLPAVGVIGCGTANGLASSLVAAAGESVPSSDILTHAFLIAKGETVPADLAEYTVTTTKASSAADDNNKNNETNKKKYISFLTFTYGLLADIDIESEKMHWLGSTRFDVWGALSVLRRRSYRATFRYTTSAASETDNGGGDDDDRSTWETVEDDFVGVVASQVTHCGKTVHAAPQKRFGDGVFHVMLIRNAVSRYRLARILLGLEAGRHVDMPGVEWIECTAYRLEPADETASYNDLDGEVIERGPVEGRVLPKAVRFFGRLKEDYHN